MQSLTNPIRQFALAGRELLFPSMCLLCRHDVHLENTTGFCPDCLAGLLPNSANACSICSAEVGPHLNTEQGCLNCRNERFAFSRVTSLGNYSGVLKSAVLQGKYGNDVAVLNRLTDLLFHRFQDRWEQGAINLILPIPHHWTDRLLQSSLASTTIAIRLGRLLKVPCDPFILRKRERTVKQQSLKPVARRQNLKMAFHVSSRIDLRGAKILLVDDVLTTGTTCDRATKLLLKSGAESVQAVVLTRGVGV